METVQAAGLRTLVSPKHKPNLNHAFGWFPPALGLVLIVAALYGQVAGHDYVYIDDKEYVYNNPVVKQGLSREGAVWAVTSIGYANNWHPLTWLSHMLDVQLFGLDPGAHHLVNVAFHAANTLLLFLLLLRLTGLRGRSAFVALLFAIHPLHVESVAWVAERKDLLSSFFGIGAVWCYAGYVRRPGVVRYLAALGMFLLGLLAKPMILTLPLVLLLLDSWPLGRFKAARAHRSAAARGQYPSAARLVFEKAPFLVLALASALVTLRAQERLMTTIDSLPAWPRVANAFTAYTAYLARTVWPFGLTVFYPHPGRDVNTAGVFISLAFLAATSAWALRTSFPCVKTGWFWYLVMLFPVIGLVQVGPQAMADRYTYLPLVGIFVIATWVVGDTFDRLGLKLAAVAAVLTALLLLFPISWRQAGYWRNNTTLYRHAVDVIPNSWMGHSNLGAALEDAGDIEGAVAHYREAIRIRPNFSPAYNNLALVLFSRGRVDEALALFSEAVRLTPRNVRMLTNYAVALAARNRTGEAREVLGRALQINPADQDALQELARLPADGQPGQPTPRSTFPDALSSGRP